jgi:predicted DNA-binding transcriptional regulator AlpA
MARPYARVAPVASTFIRVEELVGLTEVATLVGISRQRVLQLIESDPDFPEPAAQMARGRVWKKADIVKWAKATGREIK